MSDDSIPKSDWENEESDLDLSADASAEDEEFEEISSDEVDTVVSALENLIEKVESENIKAYLEEAMNGIYFLVYEDDEDDDVADAA